jgi:hypothetical protein
LIVEYFHGKIHAILSAEKWKEDHSRRVHNAIATAASGRLLTGQKILKLYDGLKTLPLIMSAIMVVW